MINGTEDFKDVMKNMFDELRQYFIKAVLDAVMNRLISENAGESIVCVPKRIVIEISGKSITNPVTY